MPTLMMDVYLSSVVSAMRRCMVSTSIVPMALVVAQVSLVAYDPE
jgi:hypothetical protein